MAYGNIAARLRMGLSARAYRSLHQWAAASVPGFSGRHEDMSWPLVAGVTARALQGVHGCGPTLIDEIAAAMSGVGLAMADHGALEREHVPLARGSRVYLAGRARALIVADYALLGEDVLMRLRPDTTPDGSEPGGPSPERR